jgi:uncharacterized protein YuzE
VSGPDVCLTPMGNSMMPVPYSNTARSASLKDGTMTVTVNGGMGAIDGCRYGKSTGDEAGSGRGIGSGTVAGSAEFINSSFDVKIEGRGACRNSDPMTHNNRNALGVNQDSSNSPLAGEAEESPARGTFRIKVVEHLSWDAYDSETQGFRLGHKDNKPMAGRAFKIAMPDGSVVEKTADADGVIEIKDLESGERLGITFSAANARLNNQYFLFYNKRTPLKKKL